MIALTERERQLLRDPRWGDVMFGALVEWGITSVLITVAIAWVEQVELGRGLLYLLFAPVLAVPIVGVATGLCSGLAYLLARLLRGVANRLAHLAAFFGLGTVTSSAVALVLLGGWPRDLGEVPLLVACVLPTAVGVTTGWAIALLRAMHREGQVERAELAVLS